MNSIEELQETLMMINILLDQIDKFYSVNSTLIKDIKPASTKFVLEKAAGLIAAQVIKEAIESD